MENDTIENVFSEDKLRPKWQEIIEAWDADDETKEAAVGWVEHLRTSTIALAEDCFDGDSLKMSMATRYLELEATWFVLNTLMTFQLWTGKANTDAAFRGSLVSTLIEQFQGILPPAQVEKIKQTVGDLATVEAA